MFCFRPESYVKLHRIEQCIPEMSSLKEEDAKWKINIKHEPACALHTKPDVKMKKEPGSRNEKPLKHDPGYTPTHDLSVVKHDPGYTPAHDLSDDGDGDVDVSEKIIRTEPDVSDGKTGE